MYRVPMLEESPLLQEWLARAIAQSATVKGPRPVYFEFYIGDNLICIPYWTTLSRKNIEAKLAELKNKRYAMEDNLRLRVGWPNACRFHNSNYLDYSLNLKIPLIKVNVSITLQQEKKNDPS